MKLLKFYAEWCSPCKIVSKQLESFDKIPVENIDIDIKQTKVDEYGIRGIPTLILVDSEGNKLWTKTGTITKDEVELEVAKFLQA